MGNSASSSHLPALRAVESCDTARFMGTWFVIAVKPTMFEKTCSNAVERYSWNQSKKGADIDIDFRFNKADAISSPLQSLPQKGWVQGTDKSNSGKWKVSPFWPLKMPYEIIELDDKDYMYTVIGYPSREYCWIMCRKPQMQENTYKMLTQRLVENHQYSLDGLRKVPQYWTRDEREKRGLTSVEIPDDMLS
jgi:apolipoprotein D and lipocalin family protein